VVKDPKAAVECIRENRIVRRIASDCVEDTGGLFVTTPWDDPDYADRFASACAQTGVPCEEIEVGEALQREPRLNPAITRAFVVPDAAVDAWKLVWANARAAAEHGARVLPYHRVVSVLRAGDTVTGAVAVDEANGDDVTIHASMTVNATGAWAGRLAAMAGIEGVEVVPGKGIMIAMNHRLVQTVVNRCAMPGDGDILVPIRTVSVMGTTDSRIADPDEPVVTQAEVDQMLEQGERLVPGFRRARALRVWAGVRPLFEDRKQAEGDTRDITRAHTLLDHLERDGVHGFVTITGGKATTYRLMAEETVDLVARRLGNREPCRTADEPLPGSGDGDGEGSYQLGARLAARERTLHDEQVLCECELVSRRRFEEAVARRPTATLDDLRRALRIAMGPCQGGFCIPRAAGVLHASAALDATAADRLLREFLQERWKGVAPILYGDQLRQARFDDWVFQGLLDVEHLPA
jgi:glycerol-3-phosphate dehydrogenase